MGQAAALSNYASFIRSLLPPGSPPDAVDLSPVTAAVAAYARAAQKMQAQLDAGDAGASAGSSSGVSLNDRLSLTERSFLSPQGLPSRKYFRHLLQVRERPEPTRADPSQPDTAHCTLHIATLADEAPAPRRPSSVFRLPSSAFHLSPSAFPCPGTWKPPTWRRRPACTR